MQNQFCNHEFVEFEYPPFPQMKRLVCSYCGHIREVYNDGTIKIIKTDEQPNYNQPNPGGTGPQFG